MHQLAPPKHDRYLDLVPVLEETQDMPLFGGVVVRIDLWPELDLLDGDRALVLSRLLCLLLLLIAPLAVIHDPAYGWTAFRSYLDQVEIELNGDVQRVLRAHLAPVLAFVINEPDQLHANGFVDPGRRTGGRASIWTAPRRHALRASSGEPLLKIGAPCAR